MNIDVRLSRVGYLADFVVVPAVVLVVIALAFGYGEPSFAWLLLFAAGAATWSFFEYALHRWFLHGIYRRDHWLHHLRPSDFIGVSASITFGSFALAWLFCSSVSFSLGQMFFAGFYSDYFIYRFVHHALHQWSDGRLQESRFLKPLHDAHEVHHKGGPVNFGVQTLFWDRLLGTFER